MRRAITIGLFGLLTLLVTGPGGGAPLNAAVATVAAVSSTTPAVTPVSAAPVSAAPAGKVLRRARRELRREARRAARRDPLDPPNGMAVAAFVCALGGFLYLGLVGSVLAIVFGAIALRRNTEYPELYGRRKMAKAALIIGIVTLGLAVVLIGALLISTGVIF